jgi:putative pyrroloquinoline-quinone binding quinoprotein
LSRAVRARVLVLALVSGVALFLPGAAHASDWSQFHASRTRSGVMSAETVLTTVTAPSLAKLWGAATDPTAEGINSSPAVVGGLAYIGSDDGSLWAVDALTGTPVWRDPVGAQVRSSPAAADGRVFFGSADGWVCADDALAGARLWAYAIGGNVTAPPLVVGSTVYNAPQRLVRRARRRDRRPPVEGQRVGHVGAAPHPRRASTWVRSNRRSSRSTPRRARSCGLEHRAPGSEARPSVADGRVLVGTDAGNVVSLDADTGRIQWTSPASPPSTSAVIRSSPAVDDERVFVATAETTAMSLPSTRRPGRWIGEPTMSPITRRRRPRSRTASCTWGRTTRGSMRSGSGRASCSGRRHGAWRTWSGVSTRAPRSPTGRVYIGCRDGSLYAFGIG